MIKFIKRVIALFKKWLVKETPESMLLKYRKLSTADKIQLGKNMGLKGKNDDVIYSRTSQVFNDHTNFFKNNFCIVDWKTLEVFMPKGMYSKK